MEESGYLVTENNILGFEMAVFLEYGMSGFSSWRFHIA